MKKLNLKIIIPIALLSLLVIAVLLSLSQSKDDADFLEQYNLDNLSTKQIVTELDLKTDESDGFYAAITGGNLIVGDFDNEFKYNTPDDQFYLSFAPYINATHPCGNHNLVTCRGELQNINMHVVIKDSDGNTIIDGDYTSFDNGFIGLWLPKDIEGSITVTYQGLSASSPITTTSSSNTCLTTLKLS